MKNIKSPEVYQPHYFPIWEHESVILNRAQCARCKKIITSEYHHHYNCCKCKTICVDGGQSYLRRSYKLVEDIIEMSVYQSHEKDFLEGIGDDARITFNGRPTHRP